MTDLRALLAPIRERLAAATPGPWVARTTGRAGGDHWYVCDAEKSVASIHASDGEDEDQREPDAEFIANAPTDLTRLLAAIEAVTELHVPVLQSRHGPHREMCRHDTYDWPCPTVTALTAALGSDTTNQEDVA